MNLVSECIPCLVRQCHDAVRRATSDEPCRHDCLRAALRLIAEAPAQPPPVTAAAVQALVSRYTSCQDPYARDKEETTRLALALMPRLRESVARHPRPFEAACRLAIAANVLDLGVTDSLPESRVTAELERAFSGPFDPAAAEALEVLARGAGRVLWLCDNAGEVVLDRLLIERFPRGSVTVAVRGGPALNDATRDDALAAGLAEVADIIETGSAIPGTVLPVCSEAFRSAFETADLIVSKGQGNYETLESLAAAVPLVFLLKIKCDIVSRHTGMPLGAAAVLLPPGVSAKTAAWSGRQPQKGYRGGV